MTRTMTGARQDTVTLIVDHVPAQVSFVQPMPSGAVLLAVADDGDTAGVWDGEGHKQPSGCLGDALEHVLTSPSGQVWVGYFDEASGRNGRPTGVAQFNSSLGDSWRCRWDQGMLDHFDCYALNLDGETATTYAYTAWYLTRISGDSWIDLNHAPHKRAAGLLLDGDGRAVLIGGYDAE